MPKIVYLSVKDTVPATGYWDHEFIKDIFEDIPETDRQVVVIPGAYQWDVIDKINERLAEFKKILVIVTSDEESKFNVNKLDHPDMIVYSQYGNGGLMFPLGYSPGTRDYLKGLGIQDKTLNWFFAGQITHSRRQMLAQQLRKMDKGFLLETDGFAKGLTKPDYISLLSTAKTVPCSPGPISVDSFRLYEALEAGCVPIADDVSPLVSYRLNYWRKLFGGEGFPTFINYDDLPDLINRAVEYPNMNNKVLAWWINKKYQFKEVLKQQLGVPKDEVVVVVPASPIPSHPSTYIIDETIRSIKAHLPNAPILVTMDGVRPEQEDRRADYEEFQRKFLWKCNFEYKNVLPVIFDKHAHQSGMMKVVLKQIDIPMILYVEHDTPLTPDRPIDWEKCKDYIKSGKSNVIRFHFEEVIPEPHKHLMIGQPEDGFLKTAQWSQRPHLASTEMYKVIMALFSDESNCFIEDRAHGLLQNLYNEQGVAGWQKWAVHIYHPDGGIKRSYNLDGREDDKKYEAEQVW